VDSTRREADCLKSIVKILAASESWPELRFPKNYLVADLETLGLDVQNSNVVQIGFCTVQQDAILKELWDTDYFTIMLKWPPEKFVGKEDAIRTHGITAERSAKEGIDPKEALLLARDVFQWARDKKYKIIGHNFFRFDMPFFQTEFRRQGIDFEFKLDEIIDTGMLVKAMQLGMLPGVNEPSCEYWRRVSEMRARGVYFRLDGFCVPHFNLARHGADSSKAHDAGYDCFLTHLLLREMNYWIDSLNGGGECREVKR
jgi:DNA polymerase III epsilon subunit-like protein